jgi:hypothetical protein
MPTGTAAAVVQDVPVDDLTEARTRRAAGGTSNDALDDHASRRTQQYPDGATQDTDLRARHGRGDAASGSYDGANGPTEASC